MDRTIVTLESLEGRVGEEIAASGWYEVTQHRIDLFADATEDHQWIHVDPSRARASPFGTTIAHGFLTLSLSKRLADMALEVTGCKMGVNYGLNRVRFTAPVPSGSKVRGRFKVSAFERIDGGAQVTWGVTLEREGAEKPCMVAEWLVRYHA